MNVGWYAAPVVVYGHAFIGVDRDFNAVAKASQRLVHAVVHHFINQVMHRFAVGATHIHSGAFSDSFQPFQNLNLTGAIVAVRRFFQRCISHNVEHIFYHERP